MPFSCPSCLRPIANRKSSVCGYCGHDLPAELLMTEEQRNAVEEIKKEDEAKHKKWKEEQRKIQRRFFGSDVS